MVPFHLLHQAHQLFPLMERFLRWRLCQKRVAVTVSDFGSAQTLDRREDVGMDQIRTTLARASSAMPPPLFRFIHLAMIFTYFSQRLAPNASSCIQFSPDRLFLSQHEFSD